MIIFGSRGTRIGATTCNMAVCTHCENKSFVIHTFSRYFHIFWIPMFPFQKKHIAECTHCKKTYAQAGFTASMNEAVAQNPAKTAIWEYSGLLIFGGFVLLSMIFSFFFEALTKKIEINGSYALIDESKKLVIVYSFSPKK